MTSLLLDIPCLYSPCLCPISLINSVIFLLVSLSFSLTSSVFLFLLVDKLTYCFSKLTILLDKFLLLQTSFVYSLLNKFHSVLVLYDVCLYAVLCVNSIVGILIFVAWPWPLFFLLNKITTILSLIPELYSSLRSYLAGKIVIYKNAMKLLLKRAKGVILHASNMYETLMIMIFHRDIYDW